MESYEEKEKISNRTMGLW